MKPERSCQFEAEPGIVAWVAQQEDRIPLAITERMQGSADQSRADAFALARWIDRHGPQRTQVYVICTRQANPGKEHLCHHLSRVDGHGRGDTVIAGAHRSENLRFERPTKGRFDDAFDSGVVGGGFRPKRHHGQETGTTT